MELLSIMFPTILDVKNKVHFFFFFFQNSAKDKMTLLNISVAVKPRSDKKFVVNRNKTEGSVQNRLG